MVNINFGSYTKSKDLLEQINDYRLLKKDWHKEIPVNCRRIKTRCLPHQHVKQVRYYG